MRAEGLLRLRLNVNKVFLLKVFPFVRRLPIVDD